MNLKKTPAGKAFGGISLHTIADGGNPRNSEAIWRDDFDTFSITPFSEDNDPNYKFRCEVMAENLSGRAHEIQLKIHWHENLYARYRSHVYLKYNNKTEWVSFQMENRGGTAQGRVILAPGLTTIASQPAYNLSDLNLLYNYLAKYAGVKVESIGHTRQNRKIKQIVLNDTCTSRKKRTIVLVCRVHPYETGGSYCAEGILHKICSGKITHTGLIGRHRVHLIPMANPDGVYNGFCKRTEINGIDLSKQIDPTDPTCATLLDFLDTVRPDIYCEFHNWMLPHVDGIYYMNWFQARRLILKLPPALFKPWKIELRKKFLSARPEGLKEYCSRKFKKPAFVLEFPWFGRTSEDMKTIGFAALNAMAQF